MSSSAASAPSSPGPYPGLVPYSVQDAPYFFGREREGKLLVDNLLGARLTVVYGESGVGKSSVLRAEVMRRLEEDAERSVAQVGVPELAIVVVNDWIQPVEALHERLAAAAGREADEAASLEEAFAAVSRRVGGRVFVILDQFEDYFLYHPANADGGGGFATQFARLVENPDVRANFLVSIREDAVARLDRFKGRLPVLFDNSLRIERLSRAEAREAIVRPINRFNELVVANGDTVEIEPELVEAVLTELTGGAVTIGAPGGGAGTVPGTTEDTVEAPFLQLVMRRLWAEEMAAGSHTLRLRTFERLEGAAEIVTTHVDSVMRAFGDDERQVAARIFRHLVTPSGTRIAHTVTDLSQLTDQPEQRVDAVIEKLAGGAVRILRPVAARGTGAGRFEIFHDVLAQAVLRYVADQREREVDRARRKELTNRFVRILAVTLLLAVIVTAALTVLALRERDRARSAALVAQSLAPAQADPELGVLLAREALERDATDEAADALVLRLSQMHLVAALRGPPGAPEQLVRDGTAFTPDGARVVSVRGNGATISSVATGAVVHRLTGHRDHVFPASFSPDGSRVVTPSRDGTARIWDARSGAVLHTLQGPETGVNGAQVSTDGRRVLTSGGSDATVTVWSAATGRRLRTIAARAPLYAAAFDPAGDRIVTAQTDSLARVWDVRSGRLAQELRGHRGPVYAASFDRSGRRIVTSGLDGTARVWNARSGAQVAVLAPTAQASAAEFSQDGHRVVTTGERAAQVWNAADGARVATLRGHADALNTSTFSRDGTLVATTSEDRTAIVWDVATARPLRELRGHTGGVLTAAFAPSGRRLVTASEDGTTRTWAVGTGTILRRHAEGINAVAFSPDGRLLASGGEDGSTELWDVQRGRRPARTLDHGDPVAAVAFSGDGRRLATAATDMTVRLWTAATGRLERTIDVRTQEPTDAINAVDLSRDGRTLLVATEFVGAQILDVATGRRRHVLDHDAPVWDAALSQDDGRVVTADLNGVARVWDAATGAVTAALRGHLGGVVSADFSPYGRLVVTGSSDGTAIVWDAATGRRLHVLREHDGQVNAVRFSPDGRRIVTVGDTTARVWSTESGRLLGIVAAHAGIIRDVDVSPRGGVMTSAGDDRALRLYRCATCVPIDDLAALATRRATRALTPLERREFLGG